MGLSVIDENETEEEKHNRRSSDIHRMRNRALAVLTAFSLWWAGNLYADYRNQTILVHRLEVQIAETQKDVDAIRTALESNANLSSDERKEIVKKLEAVQNDVKQLNDKLLTWFRPKNGR